MFVLYIESSSSEISSNQPWAITAPKLHLTVAFLPRDGSVVLVNQLQKHAILLNIAGIGVYNLKEGEGFLFSSNTIEYRVSKSIPGTSELLKNKNSLEAVDKLSKHFSINVDKPLVIWESFQLPNAIKFFIKFIVEQAEEFVRNLVKFATEGIEVVINTVLNTATAITSVLLGIVFRVSNFSVTLTSEGLFGVFRNLLMFTGIIGKGVIESVSLGTDMVLNFYDRSTNLLFTVATDGAILVNDAVVGTIENAQEVLGDILGDFKPLEVVVEMK